MGLNYTTIQLPDTWKFDKKDRTLRNEGDIVKCIHKDGEKEIWIEGILDEDASKDEDAIGFWGVLLADGVEVEGPVHFTATGHGSTDAAREVAVEWLTDTMNEYA